VRRANRLFQIIQILRRARRPVRAQDLAAELETSSRTIYRDIAELGASGVPIQGEAGRGYLLDRAYDMPSLMFTADELEAAVIGARWVATRGDTTLANGARDLLAKISAAVPAGLRPLVLEGALLAPSSDRLRPDTVDMGRVRRWIRERRKMRVDYKDEKGRTSSRTIWPIAAAYFDDYRVIAAWCELRREFRHFRADRIRDSTFLGELIPRERKTLLAEWRESERQRNYCQLEWEMG
jgi:predicted DNA-binding transcriptional regulator YafY